MKIKPVVMDHLYTAHTSFVVDFELNYNITFIQLQMLMVNIS